MLRLPSHSFWIGCFCFFLAIALQIQTTFFYSFEAYKGLRLCLADLIIPVAGIFIGISLLRGKSRWPLWRVPYAYGWLGGLLIILIAAQVHTYLLYDQWSFWGLTNKIPGMVLISAYFCLGGWLAANLSPPHLIIFFRGLFVFFIGLMVCELTALLWQNFYNYNYLIPLWPDYPLKGLMDNRNVYALFALIASGLLFSFTLSGIKIMPRAVSYAVAMMLPYFLVEIGSRASFIAAIVLIIGLFGFYRLRTLPLLGYMMAGAMIISAIYYTVPERLLLLHHNQLDIIERIDDLSDPDQEVTEVASTMAYQGDNFRLQVLKISKDMIMERPVFGSGLGSSFIVQKEVRGSRYDVIESTPIWLWVETGLIGLLAFGAFYYLCAAGLWAGTKGDDIYAALNRGALIALGVFTVMTCLHEMMYTRQIWFLLGLALAVPIVRAKTHPGV